MTNTPPPPIVRPPRVIRVSPARASRAAFLKGRPTGTARDTPGRLSNREGSSGVGWPETSTRVWSVPWRTWGVSPIPSTRPVTRARSSRVLPFFITMSIGKGSLVAVGAQGIEMPRTIQQKRCIFNASLALRLC
jgi:hypothetical protein